MSAPTPASVRALLGRPRPEAVRGALAALDYEDSELRGEAVAVLRTLEAWDDVRAAIRAVPVAGAQAAVLLGEPSLIPDVEALLDDPNGSVRAAAISALARLVPADQLAQRALALLGDPSPEVRGQAALALARLREVAPVEALKAAQQRETDLGARVLITDALWGLGRA